MRHLTARRHGMRPVAITGLALAVGTLTACAGPRAPYDVGNQAAPVNLILGEHQAVVVAPVGPVSVALPPGLAPFLPSPAVRASLPPVAVPTPGPPCPDFDPLAPVSAGTVVIPGPPQPGTYTYRGRTTDTVGKSTATFTGPTTWTVSTGPVNAGTGGYDVTVTVAVGTAKSSRVFLVLPQSVTGFLPSVPEGDPLDAPDGTDPNTQVIDAYNSTVAPYGLPQLPRSSPNVGRFGPAGVYLVSQTTGSSTFKPTVPIPLLQTPVGTNSFTAIGTDGTTAMTFKSTVTKVRNNVNACGKKVEGVEVHLTNGVVAGLTPDGKAQQVSFDETIDFGLQFGGLPIHDAGKVSGLTLPGGGTAPDTISRTFDFTTNTALKPAKA